MAHDEEQLAPETIEEQLDHLAQALHFKPPDAAKTPGMQVVEALQGVYEDERQADAGSLDRVWSRLAPRTRQQHPATPVRRLPDTREGRSRMRSIFLPPRKGMVSRLAVIAAVMLLVILVGSLSVELRLLGIHQKHPNNEATVVPIHATATQTPIPQPVALATIHMLDEARGWAITEQKQIIRTSDGGTHWQDVTPPELKPRTGELVADFLDASHAWLGATILGASDAHPATLLFRTADGATHGARRLSRGISSPTRPPLLTARMAGSKRAWALPLAHRALRSIVPPMAGQAGPRSPRCCPPRTRMLPPCRWAGINQASAFSTLRLAGPLAHPSPTSLSGSTSPMMAA